jgi:hypothetical protein
VSDKRYSRTNLDTLSAMLMAQKMISGPATNQRRLVARLALAFAMQNKTFRWLSLDNPTKFLHCRKKDLKLVLKGDKLILIWVLSDLALFLSLLNTLSWICKYIQYSFLCVYFTVKIITIKKYLDTVFVRLSSHYWIQDLYFINLLNDRNLFLHSTCTYFK